jgi:putative endonuclease
MLDEKLHKDLSFSLWPHHLDLIRYCSMVTKLRRKGDEAEKLAVKYLERNGFKVLDKNFLKRGGEIDIICQKDNITHFVEVKSSCSNFIAEENLTSNKLRKIIKTAHHYVLKNNLKEENLCFDLITVRSQEYRDEITYYPNIDIDFN